MKQILPILFYCFIAITWTNCKEAPLSKTSNPAKTNIRFAGIENGYKEYDIVDRLSTNKTEITSKVFQMEGPAWENENVAFRNYFDARNGIDIFGKRTERMILDSVGIDQNYHELNDWGMDILKVGNSLGAGAIALRIGNQIFRLGENSAGTYRLIKETEDSSSFTLSFDDWKVNDRLYKVLHTIEILSGTHYYKSSIHIEGLKGDEHLLAGIVALHDILPSTSNDHFTIYATHGQQAEGNTILGMAIVVPNEVDSKYYHSDQYESNIDNSHLIEMQLSPKPTSFYFFAGWELEDSGFRDDQFFIDLIKEELKSIRDYD